MATIRAREPGWADVLEDHAAQWATARRLVSQLGACEAAALAFCRLLERWARGDAYPSTAGARDAALRHAADRIETALTGLDHPLDRYLLELESDHAEGRSWYGGPGAGELLEWEPVLKRAGSPRTRRASRRRTSSSRCSSGRCRALQIWPGSTPCRTARRSGPVSSTCARTSSAPRSTCAHLLPELTVVGSINLDLVARVEALPRPGETVSGATLERIPGGKGANQAVAAARLDADVRMVGCVGRDANAGDALAGLREAGVALDVEEVGAPTGVAIILVGDDGENVIVVVPGANALVGGFSAAGNVLCQLEIPDEAVREARAQAGWLCVNAAPARPLVVDADLVVVNRYEAEVVGDQPLIALTLGEEGAVLLEHGKEVTRAKPPHVEAVDGTGAGDAFTACLVVSLLEGRDPEEALRRACAAGALAASRFGAQPSLPTAAEVDAILRA